VSKGIYAKMLRAQQKIIDVPKSGFNKAQNYPFRTIDDVLATCKLVFDEVGLLFYPIAKRVVEYKTEEVASPKGPKSVTRILIECTYHFQDPDDGSYQPVTALGEGIDFGGDKATYKAETGAQKYALTQALNIPCDGMDAERDVVEGPARPQGR
jgi:hypothetical protein